MHQLTKEDLEILKHYAKEGNRELYWNYLAHKEGADGYGLLALGVVRNDSTPGQVANMYAASYAASQHKNGSEHPDKHLSEREWDNFGIELIRRDLERRLYWSARERPDLALNLPAKDVQQSHDDAFKAHELDANCWTPRILLEATREKLDEASVQKVWGDMLNNNAIGFYRAGVTPLHIKAVLPDSEAATYVSKLGYYETLSLSQARDHVDPNIVGIRGMYHHYSASDAAWYRAAPGMFPMREPNPEKIEELDEIRSLRLERQIKATQFHPDDPYRELARSPGVVSNGSLESEPHTRRSLADILPTDADFALMQQVRGHVEAIDADRGRPFDEHSERLTASVMMLARANNLESVDHVVLSAATAEHGPGRNVFVVQGDLNDPAHRRAAMSTQEAVQTPVEQSLQRLEVASADRAQALAQSQQQEVERHAQENPAIRMG